MGRILSNHQIVSDTNINVFNDKILELTKLGYTVAEKGITILSNPTRFEAVTRFYWAHLTKE